MSIRDLLNKARWSSADLHALEVHVVHRGAPNDLRIISGSRIQSVTGNGIELTPEGEEADAVFIPYHRFLAIHAAAGAVLWSKENGMKKLEDTTSGSGPAIATVEIVATEVPSDIDVVLHPAKDGNPLVIDGSAGEGGGQLLRSSLTLSMATGTPFVLDKIRAGRKKSGLMRQHLTCVKAAALVCNAQVEGAEVGSSRILFRPGPIAHGEHELDIGSAGSVALVLQTLALPLALPNERGQRSRIVVRGGTHAKWAPPFPFLQEAWLPLVRRVGADISLELKNYGFYPAGGGEVVMTVSPFRDSETWKPLHLGESSGIIGKLELRAIVSSLSEGIARRELTAAAELLQGTSLEMASETVRSPGPGNAMWLVARDEATGLANVFSGIGDQGVRAEDIGADVAKAFLAWQASGAAVEEHLADQVMLPIALAGAGTYTCSELSLHAKTHVEVIHAFTEKRMRMWDLGHSRYRVTLGA